MNRISIINKLPFEYQKSSIILKANSPYKIKSESLWDSMALLSTFVNRINSRNNVLKENSVFLNDTNLMEELAALDLPNLAANISSGAGEWVSNIISDIKGLVTEWKWLAWAITLIIIFFGIVILIIYFYPWIKAICGRKAKYNVNNVNTIISPSAPLETECIELSHIKKSKKAEILSYVPQSYLITNENPSFPRPIIQVTILGKLQGALLDTCSEI